MRVPVPNIEFDTGRRYARYARGLCTIALVGTAALICVYLVTRWPAAPTLGARFWMVIALLNSALSMGFIYLLRRIFDNLAAGEIFVSANVAHIRHIAYLFCGKGAFLLLVLLVYALLISNGVIEDSEPTLGAKEPEDTALGSALNSFLMAGIPWLASWIMQVGLGVRNEADELKRDAELVV